MFLYQQGDEGMRKDYTDVKKHFRSWLKNNITNIRKSLNANGKPPEKSKTEQIIENSYKAQPIIEDYFKNRNNG